MAMLNKVREASKPPPSTCTTRVQLIPSVCCAWVLVVFAVQTFSHYRLALLPRESDGHRRESSTTPPPRLTLTLLALEPGQAVAAQGQLAVALEDMGSRTVLGLRNGERVCDRTSDG